MKAKGTTTLYIRNMVCPRCVKVVREELARLGLDVRSVTLGEVEIGTGGGEAPLGRIKAVLAKEGFEIVEDRRARTIDKVKRAVMKLARNDYDASPIRVKDSVFIAREVGLDYHHLSALFSQVESLTIERYLILQKIEYAKEILKYGDLTLSEIAYRMGYSSVAHLSNQFKKITGMSPSAFRKLDGQVRRPIDTLR